jgi:hypothetical protein
MCLNDSLKVVIILLPDQDFTSTQNWRRRMSLSFTVTFARNNTIFQKSDLLLEWFRLTPTLSGRIEKRLDFQLT